MYILFTTQIATWFIARTLRKVWSVWKTSELVAFKTSIAVFYKKLETIIIKKPKHKHTNKTKQILKNFKKI